MDLKNYVSTYMLTRDLNQYREREMQEIVNDRYEFDENYYRVDDEPNDGRGNF